MILAQISWANANKKRPFFPFLSFQTSTARFFSYEAKHHASKWVRFSFFLVFTLLLLLCEIVIDLEIIFIDFRHECQLIAKPLAITASKSEIFVA